MRSTSSAAGVRKITSPSADASMTIHPRPFGGGGNLDRQNVGGRHPRQCRPRLPFAMQSVPHVADLDDRRHATTLNAMLGTFQ
jgi:hypothetical protein